MSNTCDNCAFSKKLDDCMSRICFRYPPTVTIETRPATEKERWNMGGNPTTIHSKCSDFPTVYDNESCGEWKSKKDESAEQRILNIINEVGKKIIEELKNKNVIKE